MESVEHRPSESRIPGARWLVGAVALALTFGVAAPADSQTRCNREGDWLACDDGQRYPIRGDRDLRGRPGSSAGTAETLVDRTRETGPADPTLLYTSDGLVCWRHGDHAHCQ